MPQPAQQHLIHILLLWITIISIIQAVFIIVFFTAGHNGRSQNSSAVERKHDMQSQEHSTPSLSSNDRLFLGKGKMFTFKATNVTSTVKWAPKYPISGVISQEGEGLTIEKDGYYFLSLQVTLSSCEGTQGSKHTVSLKSKNGVLLEGWINTETRSTGLLSKVEEISAGGTLVVHINPRASCFNESDSVTHLDIIYITKDLMQF